MKEYVKPSVKLKTLAGNESLLAPSLREKSATTLLVRVHPRTPLSLRHQE